MAMGKLRPLWVKFKKDYPEFERNKRVKADFGPQLDKMEKCLQLMSKAETEADKALAATLTAFRGVVTSGRAYKVVIDASDDARMQQEFGQILQQMELAESYTKRIQSLRKQYRDEVATFWGG